MNEFPLQRIEIEDFRRLDGPHSYDLDAPVVLIHGPNGSGKTSILSALELGLTGQITGIDEGDDEQFKHLPHVDANAATVRVDVAAALSSGSTKERLLVSRTRGFSGPVALRAEDARFYRERCYLDQASLGRLLEIYQDTPDGRESVLARFVNELLGLEQLDALLDGLRDATYLPRLRNRAVELGTADQRKKEAALRRSERTRSLTQTQDDLAKAREATVTALRDLGHSFDDEPSVEMLLEQAGVLGNDSMLPELKRALDGGYRELLELGGQISAVRELATTHALDAARERAYDAEANFSTWSMRSRPKVDEWDANAASLGIRLGRDSRLTYVLAAQLEVERALKDQRALREKYEDSHSSLVTAKQALDDCQTEYDAAKEHASTLVEGLVALRPVIEHQRAQVCPVCDRDFSEVGDDLGTHLDKKIQDLTDHSQRLASLRTRRDAALADVERLEAENVRITAALMSEAQLAATIDRGTALQRLMERFAEVQAALDEGQELSADASAARRAVLDQEAAVNINRYATERLAQLADEFDLGGDDQDMPIGERQQRMVELIEVRLATVDRDLEMRSRLASAIARLAEAVDREIEASRLVSDANQDQDYWEGRVKEGARRQRVVKELHAAATRARSSIIQRVFTTELNDLWRDLFTRLAPNEAYVPAFGTVATNKTVEPKLITRHKSGNDGGTPRLMLSQGNLNTAALSLFLALHLSVNESVGCLVFDDPVQAMDDVHIAQFAALMRTLSKDLNRQVVIAVHERELFDYLALELSPAFDRDELITIRLGDRDLEDGGWRRETYRPDHTIAV